MSIWSDIRHDLQFSMRDALRTPAFTLATLLTLAAGIGVTTAAYSVVHDVLLRPLPYPDPDRLVLVSARYGPTGGGGSLSTPTVLDLIRDNRSYRALGASLPNETTVIGGDEPQLAMTASVIGDFFGAVGLTPFLGRTLRPDETGATAEPVAVVSYDFWRDHLGANARLDQLHLDLHGRNYAVVGVMPPGFQYPASARLWIGSVYGKYDGMRNAGLWHAVGRLRPGIALGAAQQDLDAIIARIRHQFGSGPDGIATVSMQQAVTGNSRTPLLLMLGAVALVLLIACVSIAGATVARTEARQRELIVRATLGASHGRLIRQLLTENVARAVSGGAFGVAIAWALTRVLVTLGPGVTGIPRMREVTLDLPALAVALTLALACGSLIGVFPAWRATTVDLRSGLSNGGRGATANRSLPQQALVVVQVALAIMLVVGASLLIRSLSTLLADNPGFDARNVTTVALSLPENRYADSSRQRAYFDQLLPAISALPGVDRAALLNSVSVPYTGGGGINGSIITDDEGSSERGTVPFYRLVSAGYFDALHIPVLRGRAFVAGDRAGTAPVTVITQSLAQHYWSGKDPIGHRIKWTPQFDNHDEWLTIVGVVADTKSELGDDSPGMAVYVDYAQRPERSLEGMTLVLSTRHSSTALLDRIRRVLAGVDPDVPSVISTLQATMDQSVANRRFVMYVMSGFSGFALFLAGLSLYGLLSYAVTRRRREIGVRMALGATRRSVLALVVYQGMGTVVIGALLGIGGALALTRTIRSLLFGVSSTDPLSFVISVCVLVAAALLACYLPGRRAAAIDPLAAIQAE
ncbi:MAG TPA: ABC transporter permease [Gemmatimonadales bacterium]|jgi:predicted permease